MPIDLLDVMEPTVLRCLAMNIPKDGSGLESKSAAGLGLGSNYVALMGMSTGGEMLCATTVMLVTY